MSSPGASAYSHGHHPSVLTSHGARTAAGSCGYFLDRVRPGDRILDLGCGPGSITLDLAELVGPDGHVTGIDFGADAVAEARRLAEERGDTTTTFVVGDIFEAGLEPASFDIVHAHQVLQHVTDPVRLLDLMGALCKAEGFVAVREADYGAMTWYPDDPGLDRWRTVYSTAARARGHEPDAGRRLRAWANAARLTVQHLGTSTWTYADPAATGWWGRTQADRVELSNFAVDARAHGLDAHGIAAVAAHWRDWGQDPDAFFVMVHTELVATPAST